MPLPRLPNYQFPALFSKIPRKFFFFPCENPRQKEVFRRQEFWILDSMKAI
jgi:hypothetical protein